MREARLLRQTTVQRGTVLGQGSLASRALTPSTSIRTSPVSWCAKFVSLAYCPSEHPVIPRFGMGYVEFSHNPVEAIIDLFKNP